MSTRHDANRKHTATATISKGATNMGTITTRTAAIAAAAAITLSALATADTITWSTGAASWDILTSANWTADAGGRNDNLYGDGDDVTFDDTGTPAVISIAANVAPSATTVANTAGTYQFSGSSVTAGALTKSGAGTLELRQDNSFTGMTLTGGILDYDGDGRLGSGTIAVNGDATLRYNNVPVGGVVNSNAIAIDSGVNATIDSRSPNNNPAQHTGLISGGGSGATLTITGAGNSRPRLANSSNSFTADITITGAARVDWNAEGEFGNAANTVTFSNALGTTPGINLNTSSARDFVVNTFAAFNVNGTRTLSGNVTGAQTLQKAGGGDLVLTGNNAGFSGNWFLNQGGNSRVSVGGQANLGTGIIQHIGNNPILSITGATPGSFSNNITLNNGATVDQDLRVEVTNAAAVVQWNGNISGGQGDFRKTGTGTLSLNGEWTASASGDFNVEAGTLLFNDPDTTNLRPIVVFAGATLGGTGEVGATTVNGTVNPGTSVGQLNVDGGNVSFVGGELYIEIDGTGADKLNVAGGSVDFDASSILTVDTGAFTPAILTPYDIVTASGGITGWTNLVAPDKYTLDLVGNTLQLSRIPEPTTAVSLLLGAVALLRRRQK